MSIFDTLPYSICVEVFGSAKAADTSSVVLFMSGVGLVMGSLLGELHQHFVMGDFGTLSSSRLSWSNYMV